MLTGALLCFKLQWGVIGLWCGIATGTTVTGKNEDRSGYRWTIWGGAKIAEEKDIELAW